MIKRISKPSFRLKSAFEVEFSQCGQYLAHIQSYSKITIWDVKKRQEINQLKLIKNEHYIGFSADGTMMYCKNGNGELVFFNPWTGRVLSETGAFKLNRSGGKAAFLPNNNLLDGDSNGQLMIWCPESAEVKSQFVFKDHMIRGISVVNQDHAYALVCPKYSVKNAGTKVIKLDYLDDLSDYSTISPVDNEHGSNGDWKPVKSFCIDHNHEGLLLALDKTPKTASQVLVNQGLTGNQVAQVELTSAKENICSLSVNADHVFAVVHTNFYRQGMSSREFDEIKASNETKHIHIYDKKSLQRVAKVHWPEVNQLAVQPKGTGLAIAANKNSVFLDDYSVLLG